MIRRWDTRLNKNARGPRGDPFRAAGNMNPFGLLTDMGPDSNGPRQQWAVSHATVYRFRVRAT